MKMEFYSKIDRSENKTSINLPASFPSLRDLESPEKEEKPQIVVDY